MAGDRYQRVLLGDSTPRLSDEHARILRQERLAARTARRRLAEDARQHQRVLAQIREGASRDRRMHRRALAENPWLVKLADMMLARRRQKPAA